MLINIEEAKPGMTLLEDVRLPNGSVLVNTSQTLSESLIETMSRRGIRKIQIVAEEKSNQLPEEPSPPNNVPLTHENPEPVLQTKQDMPSLPPALRVVLTDNHLSATLCVNGDAASTYILTKEDIHAALEKAGIIFGIDDHAIHSAVDKWNNGQKTFDIDAVAKGMAPVPGKDGAYEFKVRYLTSVAQVEQIRSAKYFGDIPHELKVQRIDPDTVIAIRRDGMPPIAGCTITGENIESTQTEKTELSCDNSVLLTDNNKKLVAKSTGFVFFLEGKLTGMVPFNFDGGADILVTPDAMRADITIHAPGPLGAAPSHDAVWKLIREKKIEFGIKNDVLDALFNGFDKSEYPTVPVIIAAGDSPKNGENGKVTFLFNTESSLKPKVNEDGTADFKNIDIVVSVTKGQKLAELIPPTKGTQGKNITGKIIPSTDGVAAVLPAGANTIASPENASVLVANADGNAKLNGAFVEVSEGFIVNGNVDFATGNINYVKSVTITGDVKSGFLVACGGDLQVGGTIEDAIIAAEGNVLCKLGFIGQGNGIINAKGDVNLSFTKNQTVRSRQNIIVAKEAINATLLARKSIVLHGNPLSIAGGRIVARDSITAFTIGNMSGTKTLVEVGIDFSLAEELAKNELELSELEKNRQKLIETREKYALVKAAKKSLAEHEEQLLLRLKATLDKYNTQVAALQERKSLVMSKLLNTKSSFVKIEHSAQPGTMFKIGARHFLVKKEIVGPKTVRLIDEEIRVV